MKKLSFYNIDTVLKILIDADKPPFRTDAEIKKELPFEINVKELYEILLKLERENYIYKEISSKDNIAHYYSTFDGRFFLNKKGYKGQHNKAKLQYIWTIFKTIAIVLNAIILLFFVGFQTYNPYNKSNRLEKKIVYQKNIIDSLNSLTKSQKFLLDSIEKSTSDLSKRN